MGKATRLKTSAALGIEMLHSAICEAIASPAKPPTTSRAAITTRPRCFMNLLAAA
jgi:hypothetical protein